MSARSEALAGMFEQANQELIGTVESMSDAQWRAVCSSEGWPAGVTAHHVAGGHEAIAGLARAIAKQQAMPGLTPEILEQLNAQHAVEFANCGRAETLALLRSGGASAATTVRALSDEELDRKGAFFGQEMSAEQVINAILIGHVQQHAASIRAAI